MDATTTRAPGARPNTVLLALVVAGLALVYGPTVVWLFGRWTMSVWHNAHGLFIPPLVAWLVVQELRRHPDLPVSASAWGFALLIPALALHVIDTGMQTQLLSAASIVIALPGLALLFVGWPRTRTILFPLAFTAFALPIPLSATERLHLVLRHLTTETVAPVLAATGVGVFAEGTTIHMSNATVQIADACSGFSTLYAAMAFAFLLAYFTNSTRRRVLVLLVAAPVAILSNITRMVLLLLLVAWQGPWVLDTFLHPLSGLLTFALSLPLLLWVGSDPVAPKAAEPAQTRPVVGT